MKLQGRPNSCPVGAMSRKRKPGEADGAGELHAWCLDRLAEHTAQSMRDPMAAGVRRLAVDLLERVEAGGLTSVDLAALVKRVADVALRARAERLGASKPKGDWPAVIAEALAP